MGDMAASAFCTFERTGYRLASPVRTGLTKQGPGIAKGVDGLDDRGAVEWPCGLDFAQLSSPRET